MGDPKECFKCGCDGVINDNGQFVCTDCGAVQTRYRLEAVDEDDLEVVRGALQIDLRQDVLSKAERKAKRWKEAAAFRLPKSFAAAARAQQQLRTLTAGAATLAGVAPTRALEELAALWFRYLYFAARLPGFFIGIQPPEVRPTIRVLHVPPLGLKLFAAMVWMALVNSNAPVLPADVAAWLGDGVLSRLVDDLSVAAARRAQKQFRPRAAASKVKAGRNSKFIDGFMNKKEAPTLGRRRMMSGEIDKMALRLLRLGLQLRPFNIHAVVPRLISEGSFCAPRSIARRAHAILDFALRSEDQVDDTIAKRLRRMFGHKSHRAMNVSSLRWGTAVPEPGALAVCARTGEHAADFAACAAVALAADMYRRERRKTLEEDPVAKRVLKPMADAIARERHEIAQKLRKATDAEELRSLEALAQQREAEHLEVLPPKFLRCIRGKRRSDSAWWKRAAASFDLAWAQRSPDAKAAFFEECELVAQPLPAGREAQPLPFERAWQQVASAAHETELGRAVAGFEGLNRFDALQRLAGTASMGEAPAKSSDPASEPPSLPRPSLGYARDLHRKLLGLFEPSAQSSRLRTSHMHMHVHSCRTNIVLQALKKTEYKIGRERWGGRKPPAPKKGSCKYTALFRQLLAVSRPWIEAAPPEAPAVEEQQIVPAAPSPRRRVRAKQAPPEAPLAEQIVPAAPPAPSPKRIDRQKRPPKLKRRPPGARR